MGEQYAKQLNAILERYKISLVILSEEEFSYKPLINKWSKKEILGHLIDSAYNNHQRFLRAEKKENLIFEGYDQNEWVLKNKYQQRDSKKIISLFLSANEHLAQMISSLKDETLKAETTAHEFDKMCMRKVEKGVPSSLAYLIEDYIFHLKHHLKQITT